MRDAGPFVFPVRDAARLAGVSVRKARRAVRLGMVLTCCVCGHVTIPRSQLPALRDAGRIL